MPWTTGGVFTVPPPLPLPPLPPPLGVGTVGGLAPHPSMHAVPISPAIHTAVRRRIPLPSHHFARPLRTAFAHLTNHVGRLVLRFVIRPGRHFREQPVHDQ